MAAGAVSDTGVCDGDDVHRGAPQADLADDDHLSRHEVDHGDHPDTGPGQPQPPEPPGTGSARLPAVRCSRDVSLPVVLDRPSRCGYFTANVRSSFVVWV